MIRPIDIKLNAAHPELPLVEATTFTGAPSSVFVRGVPKSCGNWSITAVNVAVTYPDNTTTTRAAVESAEGVWVATIPGTATSGRTVAGFRILADSIDENGEAVTGYILGVADFAVASLGISPAPEPGERSYQMLYFDTVPSVLHKGDVAKIGGVLEFYNGTAWEPFAAPVTFDDTVTRTSGNGVKSSGIWSAIWGALSALPTGFTSLYDWVVSKLSEYRDKLDLNVYGYGNASVSFPDGFSITYGSETYTAPSGGESIEFYGPIESTSDTYNYFWVPYEYKDDTDFNPVAHNVWCLIRDKYLGAGNPTRMMFATSSNYVISDWNATSPTLTLSTGEVIGDAPTMTRPIGATGDTLAKASQLAALAHLFLPLTGGTMTGNIDVNNTVGSYAEIKASSSHNSIALRQTGSVSSIETDDYTIKIPLNDGTFALLHNIAPMFSTSETYAPNALCVHEGVLYRCTNANGHTGAWNAADFAVATVEDVLAALRTAIAGKADVSAIPYSLGTPTVISSASSETVEGETVYYGAATLADRTANIVQVTAATALDELRITFPASPGRKVRDFGLRVEIGTGSAALAAPALVPISPTGETIKIENNAAEIPALADGTATAKGVTLLYFSENAPGVFVVKGEQVEEVA